MAKKKVLALVKIQIPAGQATPAPPVGTALGPHGVAMRDLTLENPIRAIREVSHDVTGRRRVRLVNGKECSALEIQQEYYSKACEFIDRRGADATTKRGKPKLEYEMGETVRVKEGPFADFSGEVIELNEDQLKLKVLVNIFGRETPVELDFLQIEKL